MEINPRVVQASAFPHLPSVRYLISVLRIRIGHFLQRPLETKKKKYNQGSDGRLPLGHEREQQRKTTCTDDERPSNVDGYRGFNVCV